jgi:hypothetical protein
VLILEDRRDDRLELRQPAVSWRKHPCVPGAEGRPSDDVGATGMGSAEAFRWYRPAREWLVMIRPRASNPARC